MTDEERERVLSLVNLSDDAGPVSLDPSLAKKLSRAYLSFEHDELLETYLHLRDEMTHWELAEKVAGIGHWHWKVGSDQVLWSDQIFHIYGLEPSREPVLLSKAVEAYHPEDRETVRNYLTRSIETKEGFNFELRLVRPDGEVRDVQARGLVECDEDGEAEAIFGIFQDITDRKQTERLQQTMRKVLEEEVKRRTRELRMANQELKDFAYIVSHDLRSPLINIMGFSKDLEETLLDVRHLCGDVYGKLDEDTANLLKEHLEENLPEAMRFIRGAAMKMDKLIASLLELSRLGSRIPRIETVDLQVLTQQVADNLTYQLGQHSATINIGKLPTIRTDIGYMEIIINNLVSNAVKYLEDGREGLVEIACATDDDFATLTISDNGRGIQEEDLDRIFQPFRRGRNQDMQGDGMGLAYVKMAVRQCGGQIRVTSEPGVGTTFQFSVPKK